MAKKIENSQKLAAKAIAAETGGKAYHLMEKLAAISVGRVMAINDEMNKPEYEMIITNKQGNKIQNPLESLMNSYLTKAHAALKALGMNLDSKRADGSGVESSVSELEKFMRKFGDD